MQRQDIYAILSLVFFGGMFLFYQDFHTTETISSTPMSLHLTETVLLHDEAPREKAHAETKENNATVVSQEGEGLEMLTEENNTGNASEPLEAVQTTIKTMLPTLPPAEDTGGETVVLKTTDEVNAQARNALVNILCTSRQGGLFRPSSGSGVIIDPRGVVLTNAHVAQYFLLQDYPTPQSITCTLRTGSPAINTYTARLLYISQQWVLENKEAITEASPTSNGSDDFALLLITGVTNPNETLPETFAYLAPNLTPGLPETNTPVLLAGYAAGFLSGIMLQQDLYASTSVVNTGEVISYDNSGTIDLFGLGGSVVAQQGSSGGGVVRFDDLSLQGIITLATLAESTDDRNLLAISIDHIRRALIIETFVDLEDIIDPASDLTTFADSFDAEIRDDLTDTLVTELEK